MTKFVEIEGYDDILDAFSGLESCFPKTCANKEYLKRYSEKLSENAVVSVAVTDGKISGIASYYANDKNTCEGYISMFGIKDGFRGNHIGKRLMEHCIGKMKANGMKNVKLEVKETNSTAIAFYKASGFEPQGASRVNYIYMSRPIK